MRALIKIHWVQNSCVQNSCVTGVQDLKLRCFKSKQNLKYENLTLEFEN